MKSLIFGYGVTGQSFERYLKKKNIAFEIYDANVIGPNIIKKLPDRKKLESYEMIYMSPGINLQRIYSKGEFDEIPYLTDIDIFFEKIIHIRSELLVQTERVRAVIICISY